MKILRIILFILVSIAILLFFTSSQVTVDTVNTVTPLPSLLGDSLQSIAKTDDNGQFVIDWNNFSINIVPIDFENLDPETARIATDCGAVYEQRGLNLLGNKYLNIFCSYLLDSAYVPDFFSTDDSIQFGGFNQELIHTVTTDPSLGVQYVRTRITNIWKQADDVIVRIGMPIPEFGPYPVLGEGTHDLYLKLGDSSIYNQQVTKLLSQASGVLINIDDLEWMPKLKTYVVQANGLYYYLPHTLDAYRTLKHYDRVNCIYEFGQASVCVAGFKIDEQNPPYFYCAQGIPVYEVGTLYSGCFLGREEDAAERGLVIWIGEVTENKTGGFVIMN